MWVWIGKPGSDPGYEHSQAPPSSWERWKTEGRAGERPPGGSGMEKVMEGQEELDTRNI